MCELGGMLLIDYNLYVMSIKMKLIYSFIAAIFVFAVTFLFYRNIIFSTIVCPFGIIYLKVKQKQIITKRRKELNLQFKDLLISLAASLNAGRALENAFESALEDLFVLYPSDEAYIIKETKVIINKLSYNITIEEAISDFAKRSAIEDIMNFADVMSICKRTGGNLIDALKNSAAIISDKIEMRQEIDTVLSARRFEQKILNFIPIGMVLILSITASEYIQPVFTTNQGRVAMTVSLILLTVSFCISNKIMNIRM